MKIDELYCEIYNQEKDLSYKSRFKYYFENFVKDNKELPDIDWTRVTGKVKEKLIDLKKVSEELLKKKISENRNIKIVNSEIEFDLNDFGIDTSEFESRTIEEPISPYTDDMKFYPMENFLNAQFQDRINWINETLFQIDEVSNYFEKEKNNPPFVYPFRRHQKIPFYGNVNEFLAFISLLDGQGLFFITDRFEGKQYIKAASISSPKDSTEPKDIKEEGHALDQELKTFRIKKEDLSALLIRTFYLVEKDDFGNFVSKDLNFNTVLKKTYLRSYKLVSEDRKVFFQHYFNSIPKAMEEIIKEKEKEKKPKE